MIRFSNSLYLKRLFSAAVLAASSSLCGIESIAAEDAMKPDAVISKSIRALRGDHEESIYQMKLFDDKGGDRGTRTMKVWFRSDSENEAKMNIKFLEPTKFKNVGLLNIFKKGTPADQWIYLPEVKKVRRIRGGNENESFLGSEFTLADISVSPETTKDFKFEKPEMCGEEGSAVAGKVECYVISAVPSKDTAPESIVYSKQVSFIRKDNFINVKSEFYGKDGKLEKVMTSQGIKKDGARWLVEKVEMKNLQNKQSTVIELKSRDSKKIPGDEKFTEAALKQGV